MITGLGFGLEDTGLGLGLEHAVLEPIPAFYPTIPLLKKAQMQLGDL